MSIQGLQVIYRLSDTIRLFIDYKLGVDSFRLYYSNSSGGTYTLLKQVENVASKSPSTRGKIVFEFNASTLVNWNNSTTNYIKMSEVISGIEGALQGPLEILTRLEKIIPKEYSVMYGLDYTGQKFIPISVDATGKLITTV